MFASNTNFIQNAILDEKAKITLQNQIAVKKEAEDLKKEVSNLTTQISELQDKVVAQPMVTSTPAPAKSMTLMHVGLLTGGIVVGYFLFKIIKK
jgi:hypothetical protein